MKSKIVQLVTKKDKEEYLIIQEALNLLDDFTQNVKGDFLKAIKIREIIHDLKEAEIRRFKWKDKGQW